MPSPYRPVMEGQNILLLVCLSVRLVRVCPELGNRKLQKVQILHTNPHDKGNCLCRFEIKTPEVSETNVNTSGTKCNIIHKRMTFHVLLGENVLTRSITY